LSVFNKLLKQASFLLGSNVFASAVNFTAMVLLAKFLSAQNLGTYVLLQAYTLFLAALFNPQAWQGFIKFAAQNTNNISVICQHTIRYDLIAAVVGVITSIIIAPYYIQLMSLDSSHTITLQLMSFYLVINQTSTSIGLLRYFDRFKVLALQNIVSSITLITGVLIGCWFNLSIQYFALWSMLSLGLGVLTINVNAIKLYSSKKIDFQNDQSNEVKTPIGLLRFNFYAHLTGIVDLPVKQLDTILVGSLVAVEASGVYKIIKQIGTLTTKLTGPITQVLYPDLNKSLVDQQFEKVKFIFIRFTMIVAVVAIPIALVLGLTSEYWIGAIFNDYFVDYSKELTLYLFIHALAVSWLAVHPTFLALGYVKHLFYLTVFTNIIFVVLAVLLAPIYGLMGVIMAIAIQYFATIFAKVLPVIITLNKRLEGTVS